MKRLGIIVGIILLSLFLVFFLGTSSVETTPYFETDYYQQTVARLDSITSTNLTRTIDSVKAGFARVSITPALHNPFDNYQSGKFIQVPLAGFGARKGKPATGIHDSIFVTAAALSIGKQTVIIVSADLLIMPPNIVDSVSMVLSKNGIQREQVFYSATHTHSSVGAWGSGYVGEMFAGEENAALERWLVQQISHVILSAVEDLRPARIGTGNFTVGAYTSNRLIGKSGNKNNDFSFISLEQIGYNKAIIGSYSAHATTLGADNWEISADYPGYWRRKIEETSADYALFVAGSVGSQSPAGEGHGFDRAKYIGEALADSLNAHLSTVILKDTITFSCLSLKMQLPEYNIRITSNTNLATLLTEKLLPLSDNVYLQAVRLGDMIWISTPSDFSGEYALQLKHSLSAYGFNANVTSFNGSYVGYIVPGRYFYLDEYEPKVMGWFGPNMGEYTMDVIRQVSRAITSEDNI
jgi:neutral ceramidase